MPQTYYAVQDTKAYRTETEVESIHATIECEQPQPDLYKSVQLSPTEHSLHKQLSHHSVTSALCKVCWPDQHLHGQRVGCQVKTRPFKCVSYREHIEKLNSFWVFRPLGSENVLLRGATLKNTEHVYGNVNRFRPISVDTNMSIASNRTISDRQLWCYNIT